MMVRQTELAKVIDEMVKGDATMKPTIRTKQEEKEQFAKFYAKTEVNGYLHSILSGVDLYIHQQIEADLAVPITTAIWEANVALRGAEEALAKRGLKLDAVQKELEAEQEKSAMLIKTNEEDRGRRMQEAAAFAESARHEYGFVKRWLGLVQEQVVELATKLETERQGRKADQVAAFRLMAKTVDGQA